MVRREHVLAEIRRTAEDNGGKPLGRDRFTKATGIGVGDWERYWPRWSAAVEEAGLTPNVLQGRFDDGAVLAHMVEEVRRVGRLPTSREMRIRRRENPDIPYDVVDRRFGSRLECARKIADYCGERPEYADVLAMIAPELTDSTDRDDTEDVEQAAEFGFVCMVKSGRNYKVGRTNSLGRREYELAIQFPERATLVHQIRTDDPAGIEAYWHRRFSDRRKNGEWFSLTAADVSE